MQADALRARLGKHPGLGYRWCELTRYTAEACKSTDAEYVTPDMCLPSSRQHVQVDIRAYLVEIWL